MGKITDASYAQVRMQAITEVRNYLMAANRNLVAVHRLISPVNVPYCTADETKTLEKAINYIFIDGMSRDRQHHALSVYRTTQQRSVMLLRWITAVKTNKIAEDSKQLKQQTIDVNKRLRAERVRLMAVKVKEQTGEDITLDDDEDDDDDSEATAAAVAAASVVEAEQIQESDGLQERIKEATIKTRTASHSRLWSKTQQKQGKRKPIAVKRLPPAKMAKTVTSRNLWMSWLPNLASRSCLATSTR